MEQWALEHPWMTFFIVLAIASSISIRLGSHRCKCKGEDE